MSKIRYLLLFIFFGVSPFNNVIAQEIDQEIDHIIQAVFNDDKGPGGVFLVAKNGRPIYQKSFGKANIELDVDMANDFVFQIGSMTKQFTAIAILMLKDQGKLNTHDTISKYIPDYPNGNNITIHHLLTHTSGIKDFTSMKSIRDIAQKEMTPKMMLDFFKDEVVDFVPGEKFDYNNSGYLILGYIIELVSGESYEDFIQKHIFDKIGMTQSMYNTDRQIIKKRAYGYQKKQNEYVNKTVINYSVPYASGALMSTVSDMLKWQNALNQNVLLRKEIAQKAFQKYTLNNGESFTYGHGWHIREMNGTTSREHGGSIFGYKSMGVYIPSEDIYVIGFSNCDCHSPTQVTLNIAKLVLEKYITKE